MFTRYFLSFFKTENRIRFRLARMRPKQIKYNPHGTSDLLILLYYIITYIIILFTTQSRLAKPVINNQLHLIFSFDVTVSLIPFDLIVIIWIQPRNKVTLWRRNFHIICLKLLWYFTFNYLQIYLLRCILIALADNDRKILYILSLVFFFLIKLLWLKSDYG